MEFAIGVAAAAAVGLFGTVIGFDKERSFYPVVLIVIATLYLLFAVMAKSTGALVAEAMPALVFVALAALGFRKTPWLVVAGLALHGVFDFFHPAVIANPGVPGWWRSHQSRASSGLQAASDTLDASWRSSSSAV